MIVFGSNSALVHKEFIIEPCPVCNHINCVEMNVLQKYVHVFWIPFFSMGKTGISICGHCKKVMKLSEMPETYKQAYHNARLQSKISIWTFSGLVLTGLVALWLTHHINENDKLYNELIASSRKEDIYKVKTEDHRYKLYKVSHVSGDTVFVRYSRTDAGKSKNTKYILQQGDEAFYKEENPVLKTDLKKMLEDGHVLSVERK